VSERDTGDVVTALLRSHRGGAGRLTPAALSSQMSKMKHLIGKPKRTLICIARGSLKVAQFIDR
jgi:hypothetical protein